MQRARAMLVVGAFLSLVLTKPLQGQGAVSKSNGTSSDSSGAVLPGVTVT